MSSLREKVERLYSESDTWLDTEFWVDGEPYIKANAALALIDAHAPDEAALAALKWWLLADVYHAENESIADVGGHCNHEESPPECIAAAQRIAAAYNDLAALNKEAGRD